MDWSKVDWRGVIEAIGGLIGLFVLWQSTRIKTNSLKAALSTQQKANEQQQHENELRLTAERIATMEREHTAYAEYSQYFYKEFKELRQMVDDSNSKIAAADRAAEIANQTVRDKDAEYQRYKSESQKALDALRNELTSLAAVIHDKEAALTAATDDKTAAENRAAALDIELAELKQELSTVTDKQNKDIGELQTQVKELQEQVAGMAKDKEVATARADRLQTERDDLQIKYDALKADYNLVIGRLQTSDGAIEVARGELKDANDRINAMLNKPAVPAPTIDKLTPGKAQQSQSARKAKKEPQKV